MSIQEQHRATQNDPSRTRPSAAGRSVLLSVAFALIACGGTAYVLLFGIHFVQPVVHPLTLAGMFLAILVTEFFLLYASTALGNVDINLGKWLLASVLAAVIWGALSYGGTGVVTAVAMSKGGEVFGPENRAELLSVTAGVLSVSWVFLSVAFVLVFSTSDTRGMLVSIYQLLLRLFLYVLIGAIVMVVLAVLQIRFGGTTHEKPAAAAPPAAAIGMVA